MDQQTMQTGEGLTVGFFDQNAFKKTEHLTLVLRTGVAGMKHMNFTDEEKRIIDEIKPDTELKLVRDPENPEDKYAIKVFTMEGLLLGYVTRFKNETIARLMDEGKKFVAITREAPPPEDEKDQAPTEWKGLPYNIFLVEE